MIPNLEQTLIEKIHVLPPEKQAKVLEYVQEIEVEGSMNEIKSPKSAEQEAILAEKRKARMSLAGIGSSKTGDVSERVDEILAEGINKREGWSLP